MKTTKFVNKRDETVDLNEGHAGSYSLLARVDRDASFDIQVDPDLDPTQQELVVMDHGGNMIIAKIPLTDLSEYKQITLTAASTDGSEHNNDLLEKKPRNRQIPATKSQEPSLLSKLFMKFRFFRSVSADGSRQLSLPNTHNRASAPALNSEMNSDAQDPE